MAYYPPYPNVYQPAFYPPQPMQQPQNQMIQTPQQMPMQNQPVQPMQQMQPVQQPVPQQSNGMIWIAGKAEADSWPVLPGNAVALWDSNAPVVYLRQADSTGKPSTVVYDLVEHKDVLVEKEKPFDLSKYMTKAEFSNSVQDVVRDVVDEVLTERLKRPAKATQKKEDAE